VGLRAQSNTRPARVIFLRARDVSFGRARAGGGSHRRLVTSTSTGALGQKSVKPKTPCRGKKSRAGLLARSHDLSPKERARYPARMSQHGWSTDWSGGFRLHLQTEADLSALSPEELRTICEQMGDFLAEDPPGITFNGPAVYALGQHIAAEGGGPSFETLDYVYNSSFWPPDRRGTCVVIER
jgi:hypothetical protein